MQSRWRKAVGLPGIVMVIGAAVCPPIASADAGTLEVDVWTDRGEDAVVLPGERVDVLFRTNKRARVVVYAIDTDGWVHLLYPSYPREDYAVAGWSTQRIAENRRPVLSDGPSGVVVIGAIATQERFPVADWFRRGDILVFCDGNAWSFPEVPPHPQIIGRAVGDPFRAVWAIEDALVPCHYRDRGFAVALCWFSIDTWVPRPRQIVIDGRIWWESDPDFHVWLDLRPIRCRPGCVIRTCPDTHCPSRCRAPAGCDPVDARPDVRWKSDSGRNSDSIWNKITRSIVLPIETDKGSSKSKAPESNASRAKSRSGGSGIDVKQKEGNASSHVALAKAKSTRQSPDRAGSAKKTTGQSTKNKKQR